MKPLLAYTTTVLKGLCRGWPLATASIFPRHVSTPTSYISPALFLPFSLTHILKLTQISTYSSLPSKYMQFMIPDTPKEALDFIEFVNASPSPFHAVHEAARRLTEAGFTELKERDNWHGKIVPNGKYYFARNGSAIIAFAVGGEYKPGNGFAILAAHTDSPCLKVKPVSKKEKEGYLEVGVQLYGGGLWHTWFDRDLSVAGKVMVEKANGTIKPTLVKIDRSLLRIPTLAIHLDRGVNDAFKFNNETHLTPVLATATKLALNGKYGTDKGKLSDSESKHHPLLIHILTDKLGVEPAQIKDFELCLYDTQPAQLSGAYNEFIHSARLDNLEMSFCSLTALINSTKNPEAFNFVSDPTIRLVGLFDNEEVGSLSAYGADSNLLSVALARLSSTQIGGHGHHNISKTAFEEALSKSFLISADMAHAVHPNYLEKHEDNHRPKMHHGVVLKINANQRYATTSESSTILREIAKIDDIPLQEFVVRNDSPCGSTIGPMLSAKLGLRTIDVGNPQLSMHSIREVGGTEDIPHAIRLFEAFFKHYTAVDAKVVVD